MIGLYNFYKDIRDGIDGYKTYIVAASIAVLTGLDYAGIHVDPNLYKLFAFLGLGAVRSAMRKIEGVSGEDSEEDS